MRMRAFRRWACLKMRRIKILRCSTPPKGGTFGGGRASQNFDSAHFKGCSHSAHALFYFGTFFVFRGPLGALKCKINAIAIKGKPPKYLVQSFSVFWLLLYEHFLTMLAFCACVHLEGEHALKCAESKIRDHFALQIGLVLVYLATRKKF